jgi:predicted nucleic acid-binding protein
MLVVFDTTFLVPLLDPQVKGTGEIDARISHLVDKLDKQRAKIIIPTPALSEVLIGAGDAAPAYLEILSKHSRFRIVPFGERAAVEAAARHREAIQFGDKKEGSLTWAKVKFDRQIVAIAKVEGAERIYSNDSDIRRLVASEDTIELVTLADLELPPASTPDLFGLPKSGDAVVSPKKSE